MKKKLNKSLTLSRNQRYLSAKSSVQRVEEEKKENFDAYGQAIRLRVVQFLLNLWYDSVFQEKVLRVE